MDKYIKSRVGSEVNTPQESPGFLLWQVSNLWQQAIRKSLKTFGLSHAQFVLLASTIWLEDHNETVNQSRLAKQTAMDKMMVSEVVRVLETKKLIQRKINPTDKRSFSIKATAKAVRLIPKAMQAVEKSNQLFFSRSSFKREHIIDLLLSLTQKEIKNG